MAVTGIILFGFVFVHMIGNLKLFEAGEFNLYRDGAYSPVRYLDAYGFFLRHVGEPFVPAYTLLWIARTVLLVAVALHIWAAWTLARTSREARPQAYVAKAKVHTAYASRTMRWGGVIIALFIVYHILDLTFGVANPDGTDSTPYDRLVASFQNPFATAVYVITLILLGMHLRHGLWSATQTLGQSNRRRERSVNLFATAFATLLIAGYLVVPAAVVFGLVD